MSLEAPWLSNSPVRYYTISLILGTVALAYGSVPLYKMVCHVIGHIEEGSKYTEAHYSLTHRFVNRPAGAASPSPTAPTMAAIPLHV